MKKIIVGLLIACIAISCALESEYGLPHDQPIHQELLGKWINPQQKDTLTIARADDYTYSVSIKFGDKEMESISTTAYISNIKNKAILTVSVGKDGKVGKHSFYGIQSIGHNSLVFAEVRDIFEDSEEKDFFSPKALKRYFKTHCDDADFFNSSITFVKL